MLRDAFKEFFWVPSLARTSVLLDADCIDSPLQSHIEQLLSSARTSSAPFFFFSFSFFLFLLLFFLQEANTNTTQIKP